MPRVRAHRRDHPFFGAVRAIVACRSVGCWSRLPRAHPLGADGVDCREVRNLVFAAAIGGVISPMTGIENDQGGGAAPTARGWQQIAAEGRTRDKSGRTVPRRTSELRHDQGVPKVTETLAAAL